MQNNEQMLVILHNFDPTFSTSSQITQKGMIFPVLIHVFLNLGMLWDKL